MRAFTCPVCGRLVIFENTECLHCGTALAFAWDAREMRAADAGTCANRELIGCNGEAPAGGLCSACTLTRTRPNDADTAGLARFADAETAKRRLVFELVELGLPVEGGPTFDFLSSNGVPVTTGHADGVITLDLAEADPVHRERGAPTSTSPTARSSAICGTRSATTTSRCSHPTARPSSSAAAR